MGLVFTSFGAVPASRRELRGHGQELKTLIPLTLVGSIVGAILLFIIPAATFAKVVPFFILIAGILVLIPRHIHIKQPGEIVVTPKWMTALAWLGIFLVGAYTGYFGAAGGVLMLSILSFTSAAPFVVYNAQKNLALGLANIVSAVVYGLQTPIQWRYVLPLGIGTGGQFVQIGLWIVSENEVSGDKLNSNVKAGKLTYVTILKLSHRV